MLAVYIFFFFLTFFFFFFHPKKWVWQPWTAAAKLYFSDYHFNQVSLCQSILWHVHHAYFAYICVSVRKQGTILLFFVILLRIPEVLKPFQYNFVLFSFPLESLFQIFYLYQPSQGQVFFIYIKIHVIIFFRQHVIIYIASEMRWSLRHYRGKSFNSLSLVKDTK